MRCVKNRMSITCWDAGNWETGQYTQAWLQAVQVSMEAFLGRIAGIMIHSSRDQAQGQKADI